MRVSGTKDSSEMCKPSNLLKSKKSLKLKIHSSVIRSADNRASENIGENISICSAIDIHVVVINKLFIKSSIEINRFLPYYNKTCLFGFVKKPMIEIQ